MRAAAKERAARDGFLPFRREYLTIEVAILVAVVLTAFASYYRQSLTRVEQIDLIPAPLIHVGEPARDVRARLDRGEIAPVTDHVLVATEDDRPLDWLPVARLVDLEQVPASAPGGAEPVIDQVTTLRDALSALFEANAAYGPVVDEHGPEQRGPHPLDQQRVRQPLVLQRFEHDGPGPREQVRERRIAREVQPQRHRGGEVADRVRDAQLPRARRIRVSRP